MALGMIGGPGYGKKDEKKEGDAPEEKSPAEKPEKQDAGDGDDLGAKAQQVAIKTLFAAMKAGDASAGAKALKAFMSACAE